MKTFLIPEKNYLLYNCKSRKIQLPSTNFRKGDFYILCNLKHDHLGMLSSIYKYLKVLYFLVIILHKLTHELGLLYNDKHLKLVRYIDIRLNNFVFHKSVCN